MLKWHLPCCMPAVSTTAIAVAPIALPIAIGDAETGSLFTDVAFIQQQLRSLTSLSAGLAPRFKFAPAHRQSQFSFGAEAKNMTMRFWSVELPFRRITWSLPAQEEVVMQQP